MTQEALKLALEALTYIYTETTADEDELIDQAITAIKEALAQPEQEPVGFYDARGNDICIEIPMGESEDWWQPVYTTPPQRTWVGLTDEEIDNLDWDGHPVNFAKAIEAKLKEKNGYAEEKK